MLRQIQCSNAKNEGVKSPVIMKMNIIIEIFFQEMIWLWDSINDIINNLGDLSQFKALTRLIYDLRIRKFEKIAFFNTIINDF